jgi:hypothetical protein
LKGRSSTVLHAAPILLNLEVGRPTWNSVETPRLLNALSSDSLGGPMDRYWSALLVALAIVVILACPHNPPNYPTGAIELHYYATGPWPVTSSESATPCDSQGHKCVFFYPSNLGANGFLHPILTWGNGSFGTPQQAAYFLRHMASWGFVIVASEDPMTGPGQTILDAAKYMVAANSDSTSPFFHKLNVNQVGSFGHSQGATGAVNALLKSNGLIKTVLPIELPAQIYGNSTNFFNPANLTGSIFFVDGSTDFVSPPLQGNNVYGYLGYPTAWFMDRLQGDTYAHGAFVNSTGEMFSETTNWQYVASNIP